MNVASTAIVAISWVAITYMIILNGMYAVLLLISFKGVTEQRRRERYSDYPAMARSPFTPPISIILPAFNEELTIVESVEALRKLDYPLAELIVVNDGSNDQTLRTLVRAFNLRPVGHILRTSEAEGRIEMRGRIRGYYTSPPGESLWDLFVIDKENGGKADAINAGVLVASFPFCCTLDADSLVEGNSLVRAIRPVLDQPETTVAVGGLVRIANGSLVQDGRVADVRLPRQLIPLMQIVEYFRSFLGTRSGLARINALIVLSGAFALFKRSTLLRVGGFRHGMAEDMDIVCSIHKAMRDDKRDYRITYIPDPIAWTQAPANMTALRIQRVRWHRGLLQVIGRYRNCLFRPKYGLFGWFNLPYHLFMEGIGPLVEIAGYVIVPIAWMLGILNTRFFLLFMLVAVLYSMVLSVFALLMHARLRRPYPLKIFRLAIAVILESLLLRPVLALFRTTGLLQQVFGKTPDWGASGRTTFEPAANAGTGGPARSSR